MRELDTATIDPDARLDWRWDWSAWLTDGDTITTATVTDTTGAAEPTIVVGDVSHDDTSVTVWLSGGVDRQQARLTCHIATAQGRADDRTLRLYIAHR